MIEENGEIRIPIKDFYSLLECDGFGIYRFVILLQEKLSLPNVGIEPKDVDYNKLSTKVADYNKALLVEAERKAIVSEIHRQNANKRWKKQKNG